MGSRSSDQQRIGGETQDADPSCLLCSHYHHWEHSRTGVIRGWTIEPGGKWPKDVEREHELWQHWQLWQLQRSFHKSEYWHLVRSSCCPSNCAAFLCSYRHGRRRWWPWRTLWQPSSVFAQPTNWQRTGWQASVCSHCGRVSAVGLHPVCKRSIWTHAPGLTYGSMLQGY